MDSQRIYKLAGGVLLSAAAIIGLSSALSSVYPALAQVSVPQRSASPIPQQSARAGIDLTGVKLAALVRLYLEKIDGRAYVSCPELVQDGRLVSLRADGDTLRPAIIGLLQRSGYAITESAGVSYVCPIAPVQAVADASIIAPGPQSTDRQAKPSDDAPPPAPPTVFASFGSGGSTVVDRLAAAGFEPAGCIAGDKGPRFALKNGLRTILVDWKEVKKSEIAPIVQCRV